MKTEDREKVIDAYSRGDIQTDSDILELAESLGIPERLARKAIFQEMASGTPCAGCKNVETRFSSSMPWWPCSKCTRRDPEAEDMFEPE